MASDIFIDCYIKHNVSNFLSYNIKIKKNSKKKKRVLVKNTNKALSNKNYIKILIKIFKRVMTLKRTAKYLKIDCLFLF